MTVMGSPQTLSESERRTVAAWAADCAERVLWVFEAEAPEDLRPREAITRTRAFARGELSIADAVAQTMNHPADVRCSAEAEVELKGNLSLMAPSAEGKAVLKAEFELTSTEAADPRVLANLMAEAKYSVEFDGALGGKLSADLGVADAELSVTRHARIRPYGGELFSLEVAVKRGVSELKANDPGALDARRATANLR